MDLANVYLDASAQDNEALKKFVHQNQSKFNFIKEDFRRQNQYFLTCQNDKIGFLKSDQKLICIDWTESHLLKRFAGTSHQDTFIKAVHSKKHKLKTFYDFTAGFGVDAFIASKYFSHVVLIEHNPFVHLMLEDALRRARKHEKASKFADKVDLLLVQAQDKLQNLANAKIDLSQSVFYFDFMFENKHRQSSKELELLRQLNSLNSKTNISAVLNQAQSLKACKNVLKIKDLPEEININFHRNYIGKTVNYYIF